MLAYIPYTSIYMDPMGYESISLFLIVSYQALPTIHAPFWLLMSSLVIAVQIAYLRVDVAL